MRNSLNNHVPELRLIVMERLKLHFANDSAFCLSPAPPRSLRIDVMTNNAHHTHFQISAHRRRGDFKRTRGEKMRENRRRKRSKTHIGVWLGMNMRVNISPRAGQSATRHSQFLGSSCPGSERMMNSQTESDIIMTPWSESELGSYLRCRASFLLLQMSFLIDERSFYWDSKRLLWHYSISGLRRSRQVQ